MNNTEYSAKALETNTVNRKCFINALENNKNTDVAQLISAILGMTGEIGELCEYILKRTIPKDDLHVSKEAVVCQLGDILWFLVLACNAIDVPIDVVMSTNIDKLSKRYGTVDKNYESSSKDIHQKYETFKFQWLIDHGYTLTDIINILEELRQDANDKDVTIPMLFSTLEDDIGLNGEIYPCFDEWKDNEYANSKNKF